MNFRLDNLTSALFSSQLCFNVVNSDWKTEPKEEHSLKCLLTQNIHLTIPQHNTFRFSFRCLASTRSPKWTHDNEMRSPLNSDRAGQRHGSIVRWRHNKFALLFWLQSRSKGFISGLTFSHKHGPLASLTSGRKQKTCLLQIKIFNSAQSLN